MGALQLHTSTIQPFGSDVGANVTTFRLFVHALPIGLREHSTGEMTVGDTPCVGHTNGHGAAPLACQAPPRPWLARVWTPIAPPPGEAAKVKVPSRLMGDVCFAQLQAQRFGIGHVILQHHKPTSPQGHGAGRPTRARAPEKGRFPTQPGRVSAHARSRCAIVIVSPMLQEPTQSL